MLDQITPLILTYNEAPNLERTLRQISWAKDIVVVDSFSEDGTTSIVSGFPQARVYKRVFDSHCRQWNFGLKETSIQTDWVLALDADYVLSDELISEIRTLKPEASVGGYSVDFTYCLNGKLLRSGIYPSVAVLYRASGANYEQDGHTQRVNIRGEILHLRSRIIHDDRKPLSRWLHSQVKYAELEAQKLLSSNSDGLPLTDRIRNWRVVAPGAMLFYCLILRGGFLDGWSGLFYAFQRTLVELMLSLNLMQATVIDRVKKN
jgi:glycosyltransferase involved in cell wall biosynthesis